MATVFGVFGAQSFVVLVIALVGLIPIVIYYEDTPRWFLLPYVFLGVAAFATNFENALLPDVLNFTEHLVGNMGAGLAFAVAAYMYRRGSIVSDGAGNEATTPSKTSADGEV